MSTATIDQPGVTLLPVTSTFRRGSVHHHAAESLWGAHLQDLVVEFGWNPQTKEWLVVPVGRVRVFHFRTGEAATAFTLGLRSLANALTGGPVTIEGETFDLVREPAQGS